MATGQISRHRRLVAAKIARENAEVLWESEGEETSAAAEEEVFGLEVSEGNLLLYSIEDFPQTTGVEWERIGISKDGINIVVFCNYMIFLSTHLLFLLSVLCFLQL
ncbi:uncharacterized protein G2W53_014878 [Senna tora]|uniref:Uncharacterized protein n=1 Tax=Senna tora TaxID=362788 RepID=A0A835C6G7_9FABA|nr:uncharacterized protein G2W53_014878 [Senna tora]